MRIASRQSLLGQLLGGYILFVAVLLVGGLSLSAIIQEQVGTGVRAADLALAKALALETANKMSLARTSIAELGNIEAVRQGDQASMGDVFATFRAARPDIDRVYWLDSQGIQQISVPNDPRTLGTDFSDERVFRRAEVATTPFVESGVVDLTTYNGVVIIAEPVRDEQNHLRGVLASNLSLDDLSAPLRTVVDDQQQRGQPLRISMVDDRGQLIATAERERILQPMLAELPGAREALAGKESTQIGTGTNGRDWLFSAVPVPELGWAVVVQRPTDSALGVVDSVRSWLLGALVFLALCGLLLWAALVRRVSQPLSQLASRYTALRGDLASFPSQPPAPASRADEVGALARTLHRLEYDVALRLAELRTLLDTSNEVIRTLDPRVVARTVIHEARRLVDAQAAAVLVPDDQGTLQVLASEGRDPRYDASIHIAPGTADSPSALALALGEPVQMIDGQDAHFPRPAHAAGFRALLALPIFSQHAGDVVLLVSRTSPQPFSTNEQHLLATFANYATLAWEHAVLYERSDERLREVAEENQRLYQEALAANEFKNTLLVAVGHELRTPLAAIKGHATTLLEDDVTWSPDDQRHFLQTISDEADKLAALVRNLLDLSRFEAGLLLISPAAWPLGEVVRGALGGLPAHSAQITLVLPPSLPPVLVERPRIEVVLRNLLANALAYGEGMITISATPTADGMVQIDVRDNGGGIAPEELPNLFARFYRAERGMQKRSGGTGLGLAICKAFVEAHGGRIWAESEPGSTIFRFTLPTAPAGGS